ncbi:glycine/sarcosine/betaine reductase complex component C subunit beta [Desulfomonile tiedjei]|uniref:3-oxoacyl-(Acyl-carrier-protein) synthase III n=1 Tax=Desulfomonile tiedjei (strain ATCC 49306 / DSM 6799 / DCB-1) TaxID=706587 RepID=I4CBS2_DESTA|nr:glycine/sarcosine/betaine reductase complex component C subunit beta [Desulfomonile tiedjei]AFM27013.1 3-oxoacyl-(acyl-carrier-protein) synthase III [Desulfomonile tiedjei DSM 6799]
MAVLKGVAYSLVHAPNLLLHYGSTQSTERKKNPNSDYLARLPNHLRDFESAVSYPPNQVYIGNVSPLDLDAIQRPWHAAVGTSTDGGSRLGAYGEIMPEVELYGLLKIADSFDLVVLERNFSQELLESLGSHSLLTGANLSRLSKGEDSRVIEELVANHTAEGLYLGQKLVGCVRQAHETDENLSARVMLENITVKASSLLPLLYLLANTGTPPAEVDYIIECSEEACGDMNQRGGGNFAKSIGELTGLVNASGCDVRGFCAGPVHALLHAASLVKAGVFKNVVVVGGGSVAKLGMNGKDHVSKGMPVLEDMLGTFALLISENDGVNPVIRLDVIGKHAIGTGSSPQHVMQALVTAPLAQLGLKITDIDRYSVEMQNPELTEPAGAGNVPESNYRMIAALAVMASEIAREDIPAFVKKHGLPGFAPTQGHIPSGVPCLGFFRERLLAGDMNAAMVIGKGSLFLGRITNLFDGLSLIVEKNRGLTAKSSSLDKDSIRQVLAEMLMSLSKNNPGTA